MKDRKLCSLDVDLDQRRRSFVVQDFIESNDFDVKVIDIRTIKANAQEAATAGALLTR